MLNSRQRRTNPRPNCNNQRGCVCCVGNNTSASRNQPGFHGLTSESRAHDRWPQNQSRAAATRSYVTMRGRPQPAGAFGHLRRLTPGNRRTVWRSINPYFTLYGIVIQRVLTENGCYYSSHLFDPPWGPTSNTIGAAAANRTPHRQSRTVQTNLHQEMLTPTLPLYLSVMPAQQPCQD